MNHKKFLAIIPARYTSSRFPGKPLALIADKPMIQWTYERASRVFDHCYVATDDSRIESAVKGFGGNVVMTSKEHQSGTDRCWEAYNLIGIKADVVVNIQGDEPFIAPEQLVQLKNCFQDNATQIATLVKLFANEDDLFNSNTPKVALSKDGFALYFSRSVIPYLRGVSPESWQSEHDYYKHIGLYAYQTEVLGKIAKLKQGILEQAESLEQLRWLENGYRIKCAVTQFASYGVDTPEDLAMITKRIKEFI